MLMQDLAKKLGYEQVTSLNQLLRRRKIGLDRLQEMADAIGCSVHDLIDDDRAQEHGQRSEDVCAMIRYRGIHYTADTLDEMYRVVDEIRELSRD